jgi:hypothetical protein
MMYYDENGQSEIFIYGYMEMKSVNICTLTLKLSCWNSNDNSWQGGNVINDIVTQFIDVSSHIHESCCIDNYHISHPMPHTTIMNLTKQCLTIYYTFTNNKHEILFKSFYIELILAYN